MEVIHKINITDEAKFDIAECVGLEEFDWRMLKSETEEYITHLSRAGRIPWQGYFRADYTDEDSCKRFKLFFYRGRSFGIMQTWDLKGICEADDWTEEIEDEGKILSWLHTEIPTLKETITVVWLERNEWVIRAQVQEILKNTEKTLWVNVLEEVTNAFDDKRDKAAAERVAFLQSVFFRFKGRRRTRKTIKGN